MAYVRIDDGAMNHPKIGRLSDLAFRLWVWGLCYAQMHLTDGYLPLFALPVKLKRAVPLLMAPNPVLWEVANDGFQIHDYCDWNDSKERVEKNRKDARDRIAKKRGEERRAGADRRDSSATNIRDVRSATAGENLPVSTFVLPSGSGSSFSEERSREKPARPGASVLDGSLTRDHLRHAVCGRVCLQASQFQQFVRKLGGPIEAAEIAIQAWARGILATWDLPPLMNHAIQGTTFQWWDARWEEWQGRPQAAKKAVLLPDVPIWECPHEVACTHQRKCQQLQDIAAEKARASV